MPPFLRNASLLEFGITKCHCVSCSGEAKQAIKRAERSVRTCGAQPSQPRRALLPPRASERHNSPHTPTPHHSRPTPHHPSIMEAPAPRQHRPHRPQHWDCLNRSSGHRTTPNARTAPHSQRRLLSHQHPPYRYTQQDLDLHTPQSGLVPSSSVGKPMELGRTTLIPLVCLLPAHVAWNTHPEAFAAAKRIVIKATVGLESTTSQDQQGGTMTSPG